MGLDSTRNTLFELYRSVGSCVQCGNWIVRPSATLKQFSSFITREKKERKPTPGLWLCRWIWNPDSPLLSSLLLPSLSSLPSYLGRDWCSFLVRAGAPKARPCWEEPGDAQAGQLCQFALELHIPACFGSSFFEHAKVVYVCISWKKLF